MISRSAPSVVLSLYAAALALLVSVAPVWAQQTAPIERFVVDGDYRLSPGDVVIITVLGEEKLSGPLTVGVGGAIALPIVGSVQVIGKSLLETRALIARTYKDVIREPYVSVALDEAASKRRIYVGGAVDKPGSFMLPLGSTPSEAVVAAGLIEDSDLTRVTLQR
ncbi:MAG: polysaccharide biosynthesis/export family protein, partial [Armatimonadota bacterium]